MENAFGQPQHIVVLGGTSDIGTAIARALTTPATRTIVLACRDVDSGEAVAASLRTSAVAVHVVHFDATAIDAQSTTLERIVADHGDIDVVVLAFAQLGDNEVTLVDPVAAAELVEVNMTGAVAAGVAAANTLRRQGHGALVVLSSVAGERVRKGNVVYGATKAGLDAFAQGLGDALDGSGVRVLVVRPGFVHSKMTTGLKAAPLATTPEKVAEAVVKGLRSRRRTVWVPGPLRAVMSVFRHLPGAVWRRLPIN